MPKPIDTGYNEEISSRYSRSCRRLILLDYDGTLVPFAKDPQDAVPDERLSNFLKLLSSDSRNTPAIISGRTTFFLERHLSMFPVTLIAEHGAFVKRPGTPWINSHPFTSDWKTEVSSFLREIAETCPGSFVEDKDSAVVWHYRESDPAIAKPKADIIKHTVGAVFRKHFDFDMQEGNKIIECKPCGFDKGTAVRDLFSPYDYDFILAAGDDLNDEPMFTELPDHTISVKIGNENTSATFFLPGQDRFIPWIESVLIHPLN